MAGTPAYSLSIKAAAAGLIPFNNPIGVATDSTGEVYVANRGRIDSFTKAGLYQSTWGTGTAGGSAPGQINNPAGLSIDSKRNLWIADTGNTRLAELTHTNTFIRQLPFAQPAATATDAADNVWALVGGNGGVVEYSSTGKEVGFLPEAIYNGTAIDVDSSGQIWVTGGLSSSNVYRYSAKAPHALVSSFKLSAKPGGMAVDASGNVWVAIPSLCKVQKFSPTGTLLDQFGECGTGAGKLGNLSPAAGLAIGPEGAIWVSNSGANEVQKWVPTP